MMNWENVLLIVFSPLIDRDKVIAAIDRDNVVGIWFYSFPNSLFVRTDYNSKQMSEYLINQKFGEHIHFVTSVNDDYWGNMDAEQWKLFKAVKYFR